MKERINLSTNIIDSDNTEAIIKYTLDKLSKSLATSLGPYGSNTIIQDGYGNHSITKDGYTIFKSIVMENDISRTILDIFKTISLKLVNEVGDASTSSILVACKLYNELSDFKSTDSRLAPKALCDILNAIEEVLIDFIKEKAVKITDDNFDVIAKIAAISNNNDYKLGNLIYEIYSKIGRDSFINIEKSSNREDYYEITDGYELLNGYVDEKFVNEEKDQTFVGENPLIFLSNSDLREDDLDLLAKLSGFALQEKKPLVIIAKGMSEEVYNFLAINKIRNKDNYMVCPILVTLGTQNREDSLVDLSYYVSSLGIYNKLETDPKSLQDKWFKSYKEAQQYLGTCSKIIVDSKRTKFIESPKDTYSKDQMKIRLEHIKTKIDAIKQKSEREENDLKLFELEKRYNKLKGSIATLYIGGNTELEKKNKRYLIDDAVHAVKSALDSGYIIGGNLTIPTILSNNFKEVIKAVKENLPYEISDDIIYSLVQSIMDSFLYSYKCVLRNSHKFSNSQIKDILLECIVDTKGRIYNLVTDRYEDISETSVINSADTDIQILHSVFSIIGLLVTSNQFLSITAYSEEAFKEVQNHF